MRPATGILVTITWLLALGGLSWGLRVPVAAAVPTPPPVEPQVVGGEPIADGQHPWLAAIVASSYGNARNGQFCGGTLIAPEWVLTSAHCVVFTEGALSPWQVDVVLGRLDLTTNEGERLNISEIRVYPTYGLSSRTNEGDVALLRLATPSVQPPLPLAGPADAARFAPGVEATVLGWGITAFRSASAPDRARQASVPIVANTQCRTVYGTQFTDEMLCAGLEQGGRDSCQGDSGGPLVVGDGAGGLLHGGVVSFGQGCAFADFPGAYISTAAVRTWIDAQLEEGPFLALTADGPAVAAPGERFSYSLMFANGGYEPLTNLVLSATLPAGATYLGSSDGGTLSGTVVRWAFPDIFPDETFSVSLIVAANASIELSDVRVDSAEGLAVSRRDVVPTTINQPLLRAGFSGPTGGSVGDLLTYRVTVENAGSGAAATANGVAISVTVPDGFRYVRGGTLANGVVTWEVPRLRPGAQARRELTIEALRPGPLALTRCLATAIGLAPVRCSTPAQAFVPDTKWLPAIMVSGGQPRATPTLGPYPISTPLARR